MRTPLLLLAACCLLPGLGRAQALSRDTRMPVALGPQRQLFLDDALLESRDGLARVVHQPVKVPAPIVVGDQAWENWAIYPHGGPCVMWDQEEKTYKMWYQAYSVVPPQKERYFMCYATSPDGVTWTKPNLGLVDYHGSKANNIVVMGHTQWALTNVIKDEHASDPQRRYKCLSWDDGAIAVAFSPDGVHWTLYAGNPVMRGTGDSHDILPYDEALGKYVGYFRPGRQAGAGKRVIGYSVSDDFIHWSPIEVILRPDALDPLGDEFYQMPVLHYESGYVGFLWIYHNAPHWPWPSGHFDRNRLRGSEQTLDTQLAFSPDTRHFVRVGNRDTFLPVGPAGSWDQGMVVVSTVIPHGDELWIYYTGSTSKHFFEDLLNLHKKIDGRRWMTAIGLAKLRRDGFVSLHAGEEEGHAMTRLITIGPGRRLILNADARRGRIEVEAIDELAEAIPGFTRAEFQPLTGDGLSQVCRWGGNSDLTALAGRPIRLRITLRHADLYSLQIK